MTTLNTPIKNIFRLTGRQKDALTKLRLETIKDLFFHFPARYEDVTEATQIIFLPENQNVTIYGQIKNIEKKLSWKTKKYVIEADLFDASGKIKLRWFNQVYISKLLQENSFVKIVGKKTKNYIANPSVVQIPSLPILDFNKPNEAMLAIYPESKGITSKWFSQKISDLLAQKIHKQIIDPIPKEILEKYNLPNLQDAMILAHKPKSINDAEVARKRISFDQIFLLQIKRQQEKYKNKHSKSFRLKIDNKIIEKFIATFPYELTKAQKRVVNEILKDLQKQSPMARLVEGDVGSGKTAVATIASFAVAINTPPEQNSGMLQTAYMVPTSILARQQFAEFTSFFQNSIPGKTPKIGLLTSSACMIFPSKTNPQKATKISRTQLLKWIKDGSVTIVVGTHSLIQKTVEFKNLALAIIDEQHRFGVMQRRELTKKENAPLPHLLSMTATPIPRTLALTIYGDLDLSIIDEIPKGRKPVETKIISKKDRQKVYDFLEQKIIEGRQAYLICPRVEEPDPTKALALRVASAQEEYKKMKKLFPNFKIGLLHGKLKQADKEIVMQEFEDKKIDILVATTVVEVGVNVPNATTIIIEGAERFGLSQLHQLRGRVQRSSHKSFCFLFTNSTNPKTTERLKSLVSAKNGFELAEYDLTLRGSGELLGSGQWGSSDIAMEALKNIKLVEAARKEAKEIINKDPDLSNHKNLQDSITRVSEIHFE